MDATADRLLAVLRRLGPTRVRVVNASDETYDVAVPNRRKRWSQVTETIESRPWVRCELLDKHGAVLGFVENDGPAGEIEDIGPTAGAGKMGELRSLLDLLLRGQREALSFRDKEHATLLGSMSEMMRTVMEMLRETTVIMREQRDVAAETAALRAAAVPQKEDGSLDVDELVKILKASPKALAELAPVVGPLLMTLRGAFGGAPPPPPRQAPPASSPPPPPPPPPPPAAPATKRRRP